MIPAGADESLTPSQRPVDAAAAEAKVCVVSTHPHTHTHTL